MAKTSSIACVGLCVALCAAALPALGAEGRTPIWTPTVIPADGKYVLTRDIVVPGGGGSAILVPGLPVEHVDIDLNGFTIFGDPGGGPPVIDVLGGTRSVTIRNGEVRAVGPSDCIHAIDAGKVVIEDVKATDCLAAIHMEGVTTSVLRRNVVDNAGGNGIHVDRGPLALATPIQSTIEDNQINRITEGGILLQGVNASAIRRNTLISTGNAGLGDGIHVFGLPVAAGESVQTTIEDNVVKDSVAGSGILLDGPHSGSAIKNNRVERTNADGISVIGGGGYVIAENTVELAGAVGIQCQAGDNSKLWNNVVHQAGGDGIALRALAGFLVLDNTSSSNGGDGIRCECINSQFDRNVTDANGIFGMHFAAGAGGANTFGRNTSRGNLGGGPCVPIAPIDGACPVPGGWALPELCNETGGNTSFCDNLMPGFGGPH